MERDGGQLQSPKIHRATLLVPELKSQECSQMHLDLESGILPREERLHTFCFSFPLSNARVYIRTRASHELSKCPTTEISPQPCFNALTTLTHFKRNYVLLS